MATPMVHDSNALPPDVLLAPADGDPRPTEREIVARLAKAEQVIGVLSSVLAEFREAMALWLASRAEERATEAKFDREGESAIDAGPNGLKVTT